MCDTRVSVLTTCIPALCVSAMRKAASANSRVFLTRSPGVSGLCTDAVAIKAIVLSMNASNSLSLDFMSATVPFSSALVAECTCIKAIVSLAALAAL